MHKSDPAKITGGGGEKGELPFLPKEKDTCEWGLHGYSWLWAVSGTPLWVWSLRDAGLPAGLPRGWLKTHSWCMGGLP